MKQPKKSLKTGRKHTPTKEATGGVGTWAKPQSRRDFIANSAIYGLGATAVLGGGWYFANSMSAAARESDLTTIGNGVPAIVQIHDPNCSQCAALQKETRAAISNLKEGSLQFLVANIRTQEGRSLANKHGVGHVTLLLFDGKGERRMVLTGSKTEAGLTPVFERFARRYGG